ncbi:hypothetical protein EMQU_1025 [Enterococcus mundtii QU 25]|nr:hypothetical protein EMQU_1025 [Enterococcus mundtii QU 25]
MVDFSYGDFWIFHLEIKIIDHQINGQDNEYKKERNEPFSDWLVHEKQDIDKRNHDYKISWTT